MNPYSNGMRGGKIGGSVLSKYIRLNPYSNGMRGGRLILSAIAFYQKLRNPS